MKRTHRCSIHGIQYLIESIKAISFRIWQTHSIPYRTEPIHSHNFYCMIYLFIFIGALLLFEVHSRNKLGNYEWNVNCERICSFVKCLDRHSRKKYTKKICEKLKL